MERIYPEEDKTTAIISYITFVGWIVALVLHGNSKTELGTFHIRQSLFLHILSFALTLFKPMLFFIPFLGNIIFGLIWICLFIFWILGLLGAINNEHRPIPIIGETAQRVFSGIH